MVQKISSSERPKFIPTIIGAENAELSQRFRVGREPAGPGDFEPRLDDVFVAGFDEPAPYRQLRSNRTRVVQTLGSVAQVAMGSSHGRIFFAHFGSLAVRLEGPDDFVTRSGFELLLLRSPPFLGRIGGAGPRRFAEVFAHVKVVREEPPIVPKNLPPLDGQL